MNPETKEVTIRNPAGADLKGRLAYQAWEPFERKSRARKKTLRVISTVLAVCSIGLFVHVLLIVLVPIAVLALLLSFPLYMKFLGEKSTIFYVESTCPACQKSGQLRPYLDSQLQKEMTVQCPGCGETVKVLDAHAAARGA